jgi:mannose-6-phosphate isomerase-like protein (cupin superfamily)
MNVNKIVKQLKKKFPNKTIIENKNNKGITTEVICEIEPTSQHPTYSTAIAIIDSSTLHYHKKTTETYEVIKGVLKIFIKNKEYVLEKGEKIVIKPGQIHSNVGKETWVRVYSEPGWMIDDYINLEEMIKKYLRRE